jgi:hypothetical protein
VVGKTDLFFAESQPKVHRGLITYSRQFKILSTKTRIRPAFPRRFLSRVKIFRLDTAPESLYAPIIQPKSFLSRNPTMQAQLHPSLGI